MTDKVLHPYMHAAKGGRFYIANTTPIMVNIKDIAYGLAKECRYAGQIENFYSVAQHSIIMRDMAKMNGVPKEQLIYFLMHDAAEGYLGDIAKPVKVTLPDFNKLEDRIMEIIAKHFGLDYPFPQIVKEYDTSILIDEATQLFDTVPDWIQDFIDAGIDRLYTVIEEWTWQKSLWAFVDTFKIDYSNYIESKGLNPYSDYAYFRWQDWEDLMDRASEYYLERKL